MELYTKMGENGDILDLNESGREIEREGGRETERETERERERERYLLF